MSRKTTLIGFWIVGYALGFIAWMTKGPALRLAESIGLSANMGEALLAGLFGSTVMVLTVLIWSFLTASN